MQETIEVEENGRKIPITRLHFGIRTRIKAAAEGDLKALEELLELRDAEDMGPLEPEQIMVLTVDEARASAMRGQDCARLTEEARQRWIQRVATAPKRRARQVKTSPYPRSAKALIDLELDRQVTVTSAATGATERMTVREAIAEQVMRAFMKGKRGTSDSLIRLNKLSGSPQFLILKPWEAYDLADEEGRVVPLAE